MRSAGGFVAIVFASSKTEAGHHWARHPKRYHPYRAAEVGNDGAIVGAVADATGRVETMPDLVPIPSPGVALTYGDVGNPLVVLVHDEFGRLPSLEPYAQALAAQGFRVAVPDLYDGVCTVDADDAELLDSRLDTAAALDTIDATVNGERAAGSSRVGFIGFSTGGTLALLAAQTGSADAVVAYYGTLTEQQHTLIPCPVVLHLAENDEWPPSGSPDEFVVRLGEHGTPVGRFSYVDTEHGFANATLPRYFERNAAALAFARSAAFLEAHVGE
jgi:carboxymethylenebutenolidase